MALHLTTIPVLQHAVLVPELVLRILVKPTVRATAQKTTLLLKPRYLWPPVLSIMNPVRGICEN